MPLVRISPKHQVVIPKPIFEELQLSPGDLVDVSIAEGRILVQPKKVVDAEDAWFYEPGTQAELGKSLREVTRGKLSRPLRTQKEVKDHLRKIGK